MSDTLAELAARVAVIEQRLGITPAPGPQAPAAPTGLRVTMQADKRPRLDWDPPNAADKVTGTQILDLLNKDNPVQATVTGTTSVRSAVKPGTQRRYALQHVNAAGASPLSAAVDLPVAVPPPVQPPPPGTVNYPADLVGKNWYLTVPVKDPVDGWAMEIEQPTLAQYVSKYFELTADGKGAVFRAWHGGATTKGSKNPRSELREMSDEAGKVKANWSTTAGRHRLVVEGQVNRLTKVRPHVVIAQIHDAADDVSVWRVEGDKLWLADGDNPHGYLVDGAFKLGTRYSLAYDVSGGVISYVYNDRLLPWTKTIATTGCYFKAGTYLQSNSETAPSESTDEYAEVVVFRDAVTHAP